MRPRQPGREAQRAGIIHIDDETGIRTRKHLHDVRQTYATRLMTTTDPTDAEIAFVTGRSEEEVSRIRRIYVDDVARTVALGRRIARGV